VADSIKALASRPIRVSTDTRSLKAGDTFFALKGPHFDGHDFLKTAIEKGAAQLVISDLTKVPAGSQTKVQVIHVKDTMTAYGDLAAEIRAQFSIPSVAITGSSGKTTVKELTAHLLSKNRKILKNIGTENNLVGVPKTIFGLDAEHETLVLEMGTSLPGEIDRLASLIKPDIGILTQIGYSHLSGLGGLEGVRAEKLGLLRHLKAGGVLIVNGEDPQLEGVCHPAGRTVRVGFDAARADFSADQISSSASGTFFRLNAGLEFKTKLYGRHNVLNCLLAIAAATELGMTPADLQEGLLTFRSVPGRLELKSLAGIDFLNDTYNANPTSFEAALQVFKEFEALGKKGIVCGDMLELGPEAEMLHRRIGKYLAACGVDWVIATGPLCRYLAQDAVKSGLDPKKIEFASDSLEAGRLCRQRAACGDVVLVKGSRGMKMEKVFECFTTSYTP
jgi:UDP-N-acetylmuramoyl-tripeptide--D-alanyl-D-alanine ligase